MKKVRLRQTRVGVLLRETLAELLVKKVRDPRLESVTITDVEVSSDLNVAHVFYCIIDALRAEDALKGLQSAQGFLRYELKSALRLKHVPELVFVYDKSFDYASRIDMILDQIKRDESNNC
ncbi:MAG: 30S ribosome-binding factor RbfA [Deltaproteobacteria bacterium]|nr:30S ribosome-binding factor RbfA [Deltaproteobacteria bacterium]